MDFKPSSLESQQGPVPGLMYLQLSLKTAGTMLNIKNNIKAETKDTHTHKTE